MNKNMSSGQIGLHQSNNSMGAKQHGVSTSGFDVYQSNVSKQKSQISNSRANSQSLQKPLGKNQGNIIMVSKHNTSSGFKKGMKMQSQQSQMSIGMQPFINQQQMNVNHSMILPNNMGRKVATGS